MTVGSVKHPNVLPQPAAASSARVSASLDYSGSGGNGGGHRGVGGGGVGGGGGGGIQSSGRISPHAPPTSMMRSSAKRCLFDRRPDPVVSKRIFDDHTNAERQRFLNRYNFDTHTCSFVTTSSSGGGGGAVGQGGPGSSGAGLHHRHH